MQTHPFRIKYVLYSILCILLTSSCEKSTPKKRDYHAYFGGIILHPKSDEILFYKKDSLLQRIPLNSKNEFAFSFDSLSPGMYTIKNGTDRKYVFFDKNDSLFVRIDMNNFENKSSFFGKGMEKNNFFIELVSLAIRDYDQFVGNYEKDSNSFIKAADSLKEARMALYLRRKTEINWNINFDKTAKALINLEHYSRLESYPYVHRKQTGNSIKDSLPNNYYDFRNKIDLNDPDFQDFVPFTRYLTIRIQSMVPEDSKSTIIENYLKKLNIADSLLDAQITKDRIMSNLAFSYFLEDQTSTNNQVFLSHYLHLTKDSLQQKEIKTIVKSIANLHPNKKLPEVKFIGKNNKKFYLNDTLTQNRTILFFWTKLALNHYENSLKEISEIAKNNPDIQFVSINLDEDTALWKKMVGMKSKIPYIELQAKDFEELKKKWAIMRLNRIIILNKNGDIKNAFSTLNDF